MSNVLKSLQTRVSVPATLLQEPMPSAGQLDEIIQAALAAPDHGGLRPWRFLSIIGSDREQLGELFRASALRENSNLGETEQLAARDKALRAPLVLVVIAAIREHPKIPEHEQAYSAAAAAQNILHAAAALGFGAIWVTGRFATDAYVQQQLGLQSGERIIGFIHIGTAQPAAATLMQNKLKNRPQTADFLVQWPGRAD